MSQNRTNKTPYVDQAGDCFYALEKLGHAVYVLATGKATIRGRIIDAFLALSPLQDRDFPVQLQPDFQWIKSELTKKPAKTITVIKDGHVTQESTGQLGATVPNMRLNRIVAVAERICSLEARLRDALN